jgi:DNA polymerase
MSSEFDPKRALLAVLQDLQAAGVEVLPRVDRPREAPRAAASARTATAEAAASQSNSSGVLFDPAEPTAAASSGVEEKSTAATLQILAGEVAACTRCAELASTRTQTVFADGNSQARLVFLGEAPGADEDAQGKPFVGRAGKLLTDIIERGMKLRRGDVYIMNVIKCRPPGNRTPLPHEADNCRRFLLRQLELVAPQFICCLGAVAAQNLLRTTQTIGKLRGRFYEWRGIRVMCTYHPAYLLRTPSAKQQTWEDIQMLMQAMGASAECGIRNAE